MPDTTACDALIGHCGGRQRQASMAYRSTSNRNTFAAREFSQPVGKAQRDEGAAGFHAEGRRAPGIATASA